MKDLGELRFVLTDEMNKMFIEITFKEQMIIEKELKNLSNEFIKEFRKNKIEQIKEYHEIMND